MQRRPRGRTLETMVEVVAPPSVEARAGAMGAETPALVTARQRVAADQALRRRLVALYVGGLVGVWGVTELIWWWRLTKWRAHATVPWHVRRALFWPPPSGHRHR